MILIDNYDSFTYNLVQYFRELGVEPKVYKNDEISIEELKKTDYSTLVISPGPGNPDEAGISLGAIKEFYKTKKILGVCLGHQCMAQVFGGKVVPAKEPVHGKVSKIYFTPDPLFEGIEQGFEATRYHSLIVENQSLPDCLIPLAYCDKQSESIAPNAEYSKIIMALKHSKYPIYGVQFHPEAILTQYGKKLLENFMKIKP